MDKEKAKRLLATVTSASYAVGDAHDEALEPGTDGFTFAERDPYVRVVLEEASSWLIRLRHILIKETAGK